MELYCHHHKKNKWETIFIHLQETIGFLNLRFYLSSFFRYWRVCASYSQNVIKYGVLLKNMVTIPITKFCYVWIILKRVTGQKLTSSHTHIFHWHVTLKQFQTWKFWKSSFCQHRNLWLKKIVQLEVAIL